MRGGGDRGQSAKEASWLIDRFCCFPVDHKSEGSRIFKQAEDGFEMSACSIL